MVKNIFPALQSRGSASHQHTLIKTWPRLGHRCRGQVHVDVIGDEKIEVAVAIVIHKRTTSIPARAFACYARLLADVGKRSVTIVVIQDILAVIGYEQIVPSIVVVVANADALAPARVSHSSLGRNVSEGTIAVVAEKMRRGFAAGGKAFQPPAIYQKNIEPAIVIVIIKSHSAARCFQQIFILVLAAKNCFCINSGFASYIQEGDTQIVGSRGTYFGIIFLI